MNEVEHEHCWHKATVQHAMTNHLDEVCCHCGAARCVYLETGAPEGHGPFTPYGDHVITGRKWRE